MRIYIDTSVLGGYFDKEFRESTYELIEGLMAGTGVPLLSETLVAEVVRGPRHV